MVSVGERLVPLSLVAMLLTAQCMFLAPERPCRHLYPVAPLLPWLGAPPPADLVLLGLTLAALLAASLGVRGARATSCVALLILWALDMGRAFPGIYGFTLMLAVQGGPHGPPLVRAALALVYLWSGVHKLQPHFAREMEWFTQPVREALGVPAPPPLLGVLMAWASAVLEVAIGAGLLWGRGGVRRVALALALAMHALIALSIGPLRGGWNVSAWAWNGVTALTTAALFVPAAPAEPPWRALLRARPAATLLVLVAFGVLPGLCTLGWWDTSLSWNVYTGNVNSAVIYVRESVQLPPALDAHTHVVEDGWRLLSLQLWAQAASGANPYPEVRVYRALLAHVCGLVGPAHRPHVQLALVHKATLLAPRVTEHFHCQ